MEGLYRKVKTKSGRNKYVYVGNEYYTENLPKGLWYTQETKFGSRGSSVSYLFGDMDLIIDGELLIKLLSLDSDLSTFLNNLETKDKSQNDISQDILRFIYSKLTNESEIERLERQKRKIENQLENLKRK